MSAGAQSVTDLLQEGLSAQRAVIPLYPKGSFKLSAIVRVDHAYVDYQHRGFFRIGLFPIGVLDGVTFEGQDQANPLASLDCLRRWLSTKTGQRLEMRRVKFIFSPTNRVEAGSVRCVAADHWDLVGGVRITAGDTEVHGARAMLQIAGPHSGEVVLETSPRSTYTLAAANVALQDSSHPSK